MISARDVRTGRLFHPDYGKSIIIPIDHGFYLGNTKGLEDPLKILKILLEEEVDATIMSIGLGKITNEFFTSRNAPSRILAIDNSILTNIPGEPKEFLDFELGVTIEQALKSGFDVIKVLLIWGLDPEIQMKEIKAISHLVTRCDRWDMPLMIEPLLSGSHIPQEKRNDPDVIMHACRIAVELGADILKIPYPESIDHFSRIVERSRVPVLILGGNRMNTPEKMFKAAKDSVSAGGRGIVFGRDVWQNSRIRELIRGLREAVYSQADEKALVSKYFPG
jgi:class I fructose-bisphosphate aldolase